MPHLFGSGIEMTGVIQNGANVEIVGNSLIEGNFSGLLVVAPILSSTMTVAGNTQITGVTGDGATFVRDITDSNVTIGPATVTVDGTVQNFGGNTLTGALSGIAHFDGTQISGTSVVNYIGNDITGGNEGIFFDEILGNAQVNVTDNNSIAGQIFEGIFFNDQIAGNAIVTIARNTSIDGGQDGIFFDFIRGNAQVDVTDNTSINGQGFEGIFFFEEVQDDAVVTIARNRISGGDDGVEFDESVLGNAKVSFNDNIIGGVNDGVEFEEAITGNAEVTFAGNTITGTTQEGIEVDGVTGNGLFAVTRNTITGANGISFNDIVTTTNPAGIQITDNAAITGTAGTGIAFAATVTASPIEISRNVVITGTEAGVSSTAAIVGSTINFLDNALISGGKEGVAFDDVAGTDVTVSGNTIMGTTNGYRVNGSTTNTDMNQTLFRDSVLRGSIGPGLRVTTTSGGAGMHTALDGGVNITGSPSMRLSGPNQSLEGNTLNDTSFNSVGGGNFIELANGALFAPGQPTIIDGTSAFFDGVAVPLGTDRTVIAAIEERIIDFDDNSTLGQIFIGEFDEEVIDPTPTRNELFHLIDFGIPTTNVQTPGDRILRPAFPFLRPFGNPMDEPWPLGTCLVSENGDVIVVGFACIAPAEGSDISAYVADYMADVTPFGTRP